MIDADEGWTPLYLSTVAGMSTCLGAAVVFCHPRSASDKGRRDVGPGTMCFSLALAGSVMVTVSVVSIGPECLLSDGAEGGWIHPLSWLMLQRASSFALGWGLYVLLSRCAFPEPEEIIEAGLLPKAADEAGGQSEDGSSAGAGSVAEAAGDIEGGAGPGDPPPPPPPPPPAARPPAQAPPSSAASSRSGTPIRSRSSVRRSESNPSSFRESASADSADDGAGEEREALLVLDDGKKRRASDAPPPGAAAAAAAADTSFFHSLASFASGDDLGADAGRRRAWRVSMLLFVSLMCHNFPEGLAVCASALESDRLGLTVTVGIMIHNVPEGIAIAVPCLAARPDRPCLSFLLASLSGLAEPLGALVALGFLRHLPGEEEEGAGDWPSVWSLENVLAFVAGIMIAVSVCELFPEARRHAPAAGWIYYHTGTLCGIIVMVATDLYLPS